MKARNLHFLLAAPAVAVLSAQAAAQQGALAIASRRLRRPNPWR